MAQLMPLPLTVSCFSKIQIGFTFLVPAHLGSPGKRAVKHVCSDRYCEWEKDYCVMLHVVVSPSGKPGIVPRCLPPEAAGRFPVMPPGECLPGGYRRPPGPFMMPRGPGMPVPRHGAYMLPPDAGGTSDLQTFVNRVQPSPRSFPHDSSGPAVLSEVHGQRFPAGPIRLPYGPVEQQFNTAAYTPSREQPIKVEHPTNGAAQSSGFTDGSPADQGVS